MRPEAATASGEQSGLPGGRKYLRAADLKRLRRFHFAARLVVEGFFQGRHRSPYHDFSAEFADYRAYAPGDDLRTVDWKAYGRTDRFYVRLYRKETDMSCYLLVDRSSSMGFAGEAGVSKLEYASFLAAALAYLAVQQGDRAALALGDEALRSYVPTGGTMQNLQRILLELERTVPGGSTGLAGVLQSLSGIARKKGLLVVISDFLDDTAAVFSALGMFAHRGFTILLLHVFSEEELSLPAGTAALFQDPEGPAMVAAEPDAIRRAYQAEIQQFLRELEGNAKARGMHYQLALTGEPYHKPLESYLTARTRM